MVLHDNILGHDLLKKNKSDVLQNHVLMIDSLLWKLC